eukprot:TRINITY_DN2996_c0_g1_i1.p1 TRINITY_DN2996_c0_g1~~TRINITY_DN2996_c0_g1_i1.p1  ORF type:complete len:164 (-),score=44.86 TRINITY_DN2996_c0_g1_i1:252-743(-)
MQGDEDLNVVCEISNEIRVLSSEIENGDIINNNNELKKVAQRVDSLVKWSNTLHDSCERKDNELSFISRKVEEKQSQMSDVQSELNAVNKKLAIFQPQQTTSDPSSFALKSVPFFDAVQLQKWIDHAISSPSAFEETMKQLNHIKSDLTTQTQRLIIAKEKGY